jgi:hypothetical protein
MSVQAQFSEDLIIKRSGAMSGILCADSCSGKNYYSSFGHPIQKLWREDKGAVIAAKGAGAFGHRSHNMSGPFESEVRISAAQA